MERRPPCRRGMSARCPRRRGSAAPVVALLALVCLFRTAAAGALAPVNISIGRLPYGPITAALSGVRFAFASLWAAAHESMCNIMTGRQSQGDAIMRIVFCGEHPAPLATLAVILAMRRVAEPACLSRHQSAFQQRRAPYRVLQPPRCPCATVSELRLRERADRCLRVPAQLQYALYNIETPRDPTADTLPDLLITLDSGNDPSATTDPTDASPITSSADIYCNPLWVTQEGGNAVAQPGDALFYSGAGGSPSLTAFVMVLGRIACPDPPAATRFTKDGGLRNLKQCALTVIFTKPF